MKPARWEQVVVMLETYADFIRDAQRRYAPCEHLRRCLRICLAARESGWNTQELVQARGYVQGVLVCKGVLMHTEVVVHNRACRVPALEVK